MAKRDSSHTGILRVAIDIPLDILFDYLPPENEFPIPGARVRIPFGNRSRIGVIVKQIAASEFEPSRIKRIETVLDSTPLLSTNDLQLLEWAARYYHHPIGEVIISAFPVALRKGRPASLHQEIWFGLSETGKQLNPDKLTRAPNQKRLLKQLQHSVVATVPGTSLNQYKTAAQALVSKGLLEMRPPPVLEDGQTSLPSPLQANPEQQTAISAVIADLGRFAVSLLQGVTGSGKTEVYMQIIAEALQRNLQILVLLPEITLTPQLEQRFRQRFLVPIVCYHSKLNETERLQAWLSMQQGKAAILLGTRSALFTPLPRPGLIILDEEHDSSFKQQEGFRFSCRDVAIARGKMLNIPVLLGSATPSLESLFNVERHRYRLLELTNRAGHAVEPVFQILDIRNKPLQDGLSEPLIDAIKTTLAKQQQVLLFLNRRGFAPVQICHGCGWVARCQHCDANLVIHAREQRLRCHHCGSEHNLKSQCPSCLTDNLQALGLGTERIEHALSSIFPEKSIMRLDRDTTQRKGVLEDCLQQISQGKIDIILGTQMLAKGHHFPNVTLVAIIDIDSSLFSIDYRASERLAQLISQVSGRAGRADKPGRIILQTRQPQHPQLTTVLNKGYSAFAKQTLLERRQASLPPYSHQALIRIQADNVNTAQQFTQAILTLSKRLNHAGITILGPISAPMARRAGLYRFQLLLQSTQRHVLHRLLDQLIPALSSFQKLKKVHWSLDVDPIDCF